MIVKTTALIHLFKWKVKYSYTCIFKRKFLLYLVQKHILGKCFKCKFPAQVWVRDVYFIEQISIKPSSMSTQARCRVAYNHDVMDGK